jgi:hypothetical protein
MPSKRSRYTAPRRTPAATAPAQTNTRDDRFFVVGLMLVYLLLAAAYNRLIPFRSGPGVAADIAAMRLATNPDEAAHVGNAEVYKAGRIPRFAAGNPDFEAHQPPLYYVLIAPALAEPGTTDRPADLARWISILIGAATIWAVYGCVATAFPGRSYLATASAAFVGLLPMNINLCASITNDVLTNLVVVLGLWQIVRIVRIAKESSTSRIVRESIVLGLALAAGIYTKTSTLVLIGALIVAAIALARFNLLDGRNATIFAVVPIIVGVLVGAPWLIRNTVLYGDPVAQHIFMTAFQHTTMTTSQMLDHLTLAAYVWLVVRVTFESFWGVFDSMYIFLPQPVYAVLAAVSCISLWGAFRWYRWSDATAEEQVITWLFFALIGATALGFARFNLTFFQAQGRYLYPALLPIAFFFCCGIVGLARESRSTVARLPAYVAGAMVLLNAICLHTISS